jgi:hypothetical protein
MAPPSQELEPPANPERFNPRIEAGLREFIAEAEDRLELLESRDKQKLP